MDNYELLYKDSSEPDSKSVDNFKKAFKYYKSKNPPPDFSGVIDTKFLDGQFEKVEPCSSNTSSDLNEFGLKEPNSWDILRLGNGLFLIPNPFTSPGQFALSLMCLRDFARNPPNRTNLDAQFSQTVTDKESIKKVKSEIRESNFHWYSASQSNASLLPKLRWATLGHHHNWDTKVYSADNVSAFPEFLASLSRFIAKTMGFRDFKPEAAIVNFYPLDSSLGGHTDHSEPNMEAPLFSISLGQSAVFLIGGPTKETVPLSILLHSGDVLVMSEASRKFYHGVPKIVKECVDWNLQEREIPSSSEKEFIFRYLREHRINLNIRQVQ